MPITVNHSTPADGTFSATGATAWDANHTLTGVGTMAEQNANAVAITGGTATLTSVTTPTVQATNSAGLALKNSAGTTQISMGAGGGDNVTVAVSTNLNGTNAQIDISPTGTGHVHIKPTGVNSVEIAPTYVGEMDNIVIGATTPAAGKFTTLESTGTGSFGTTSAQYIQAVGNALYPQILAVGSGTNIPLVLQPKGTGALQAQLTDSTTAGGNARGQNAVDWQTGRTASAARVASGAYAAISGGINNSATGYASITSCGDSNQSTNTYSFMGGGASNTSSGYGASIVGGYTNTAAGYFNFIGGGSTNSGTALAAVTTQSGTMNATTAVTLSGSNANIKVGQLITGTSINNFPNTYVAAISGTSLTLSQVASGSSTSTLSFFTPHGVVVGGGNNQATGAYSAILGGGDAGTAANRNVASGDWSAIVGGRNNTASGIGSFIGGGGFDGSSAQAHTASGLTSFIGGGQGNTSSSTGAVVGGGVFNNASNVGASILGGYQNVANSSMATVVGSRWGTTRGITGNIVFPAQNGAITGSAGVSQSAMLIVGTQTTNATATALTCDAQAAGTTNQVILPNNSAYFFTGEVVSGVTGGGNTKGWTISGVIKRGANAASTALVGTPTVTSLYADAGAATWAIAVTADTTNGGIRVTFTGQAATTIRTVCQIRTTEMTY